MEDAVDNAPVRLHRRIGRGLRCFKGCAGKCPAGGRFAMAEPLPAREIAAVEERLESGGRGVVLRDTEACRRPRIVGNLQLAKLDPIVVAGENDMAASIRLAGVWGAVDHRHVVKVRIDDHRAIENHADVIFDGDDRFGVPFADGLQGASARRGDAVDRAVHLPGLEPRQPLFAGAGDLRLLAVERTVVVEDLDLEAVA